MTNSDRTLPELPQGWYYTGMYQTDKVSDNDGWCISIGQRAQIYFAEGPSPRKAAEAAIAKIGK